MRYHPYLAERLGECRRSDALREAEVERLIHSIKGAKAAERLARHNLLFRARDLLLRGFSAKRTKVASQPTAGCRLEGASAADRPSQA